jgi:phage/plasmid-associated DNA primase
MCRSDPGRTWGTPRCSQKSTETTPGITTGTVTGSCGIDGRWKADTNAHIITMAKVIPRMRYERASRIEHDDERKKAADLARSCEALYRLKALVETEPPLSDDGTGWDCDSFLLGVANGVLDLRTLELRQDRREDRIRSTQTFPLTKLRSVRDGSNSFRKCSRVTRS